MITLPPFKSFLASNIPSVYDNTLSYYDELTKLIAYLEQQVVPAINETSVKVEEVSEGLKTLKDYVDHYFDNLDVQQEINNKLDQMAEDGDLAAIISQFLSLAPVFGYDTISDMESATNLNNGCIARVLGNSSASAGDGAFYKVRTKNPGESADGVQKVAIGDTLIADRIVNAQYNELKADIESIEAQLDDYFVLFGDSWADFSQGFENWYQAAHLDNILKCTLKNYAVGGAGFVGGTSTIAQQLTTASSAMSSYEKNHTKYVVVVAGVNDLPAAQSEGLPAGLITEMQSIFNNLRTMYPNAKIIYAPDMCAFEFSANKCLKSMVLANEFFTMHNPYLGASVISAGYPFFWIGHTASEVFRNDNIHINGAGAKAFGRKVLAACLGGDRDTQKWCYNANISNSAITVNMKFSADEFGNVDFHGNCVFASNPNAAVTIAMPTRIRECLRVFYEMNNKSNYFTTMAGGNSEAFGHCEFDIENGNINFRIPNGTTSTIFYF